MTVRPVVLVPDAGPIDGSRAGLNFSTVTPCDQVVVGSAHWRGRWLS
jgi:hypothetical protein